MKFQYNDGGRKAAGYEGSAGDCVVRAIAIATEKPYQEVYDALFKMNKNQRGRLRGASPRNGGTKTSTIKKYMKSIGWKWTPTMFIGSGCKVHLKDGELPSGRIIARVSKHLCAIVDGVINDTGNPAREVHCTRPITENQPIKPNEFTHDGKFAHHIEYRCVYGYYSKEA